MNMDAVSEAGFHKRYQLGVLKSLKMGGVF